MVIGSNQTRHAAVVKNSLPDGPHSYLNAQDGYAAQNDYSYTYHANNTIALRDGQWFAGNECVTRRANVQAVTTQPAAQEEPAQPEGGAVGSPAAWREAASSCCRCCDAGVPRCDASATVLASYGVYGRRRHDADAAGNEDRDDESGFTTVVKYRAGGGGATSTEVVRGGGGDGGGRRCGWAAWARLSPPWGRRGRRAAIVALVTAALLAAVAALVAGLATVLRNSAQRPLLAYSGGSACPGECPPELAPVCGNDGVTYRNLCQLRRRACVARTSVRVAHVGQCVYESAGEEAAADPCASLDCGRWSRCQVVGGAAACRCLPCPPPPPPPPGAWVCGSDGRDYASECQLRATACRLADPRLTLRHRGKCDVCQGYKCPVLSTCHPDEQGRPQCRCSHTCHDTIESPVCGSDGTTYESECRMRMTACEKQAIIVVTYKGPCDPCRGVVCAEPGAECRSGVCACRADCPRDAPAERVCGSDGRSYRSVCRLQLASCRRPRGRPALTVAFYGDCRAADQDRAVVALTSTTASPVTSTPASTVAGDYDVDGAHKVSKSTRHLAPAAVSHRQPPPPDAGPGLTSASLYRGLSRHPDTEPALSAEYQPTPATLSSLLEGACASDGDCAVSGSVCLLGVCRCPPELTPSHDHRHCLVYLVPSFDGQAYIEMKRLKAHNKLNIEIEFITYTNDGLLLYNQQKEDGTGDFVSMAIVQGHVEFRYNLGNGVVRLRSPERVSLGRVHTAVARRYHRDGVLRVDGGQEVAGQSQGPLRALNLEGNAFLGRVPTNHSRVLENAGTARGLVGCVRRLRLGQQAVRLHEAEGGEDALVLRSRGVRQCGRSPCKHLPCQNGASCTPTGDDTFHCDCPPQFTGPYCESKTNSCAWSPCVAGSWCEVSPEGGFTCNCGPTTIKLPCHDFDAENQEAFVPEFDGNSFIELPKLEGVGKAFAMELWFLTRAMDGVLLYSGQRLDGKGDYIAVVLVSGHVQFHFELGSGPGKTVTANGITRNQWHSVKVSYLDREGTLQLDDGPTAKGMSGAPLNELNLELPLYIGGLPATMYTGVVPLPNLEGGVQRLVVNGQVLEGLGEGSGGASRWRGPPCSAHACLHHGACRPRLNSFLCRCRRPFRGPRCQFLDTTGVPDSEAVKFTGNTYLKLSLTSDTSFNGSMKDAVNETLVYNEGESAHNLDITENDIYEHSDYDEEYKENDESNIRDFQYKEEDMLFSPDKQKELQNVVYETLPDGEINGRLFHYELTFHTQEANGLLLWNDRKTRHKDNFVALAVSNGYLELRYRVGKSKYSASLQSKVYVSDGRTHTAVAELHWKYSFLQVDDEHPKQKFIKGNNHKMSLVQDLWIGGMENLPPGLPAAYYSGFTGCMHRLVVQRGLIDFYSAGASNMTLLGCQENEV